MTRKLATTFALSVLALTTATTARADAGEDLFIDDVTLRPGVTADIHLRIYENNDVPCHALTVLAIHGASATARSLEPFAQELTQGPVDGQPVCRVVTMDLPGHGDSPPPEGALFGELTLDDYATSVIEVLDRLPDEGIRPRTIVGHSMGGMVIQLSQQALLDQGSSLWDAFRIGHAVLLSPAIPASVHWTFRDDTDGPLLIGAFLQEHPQLGPIVDIVPEVFVQIVFTTFEGVLASNAMTPEEIANSGWVTPESATALGSLMALAPHDPPDVDAGIFAGSLGTDLDIVGFNNDTTIFASDLGPLFTYLTGESPDVRYVVVEAEFATHGLPQSDPGFMLDSIAGDVDFP